MTYAIINMSNLESALTGMILLINITIDKPKVVATILNETMLLKKLTRNDCDYKLIK